MSRNQNTVEHYLGHPPVGLIPSWEKQGHSEQSVPGTTLALGGLGPPVSLPFSSLFVLTTSHSLGFIYFQSKYTCFSSLSSERRA